MSNRALLHALLLTKLANAELVIVNVIDDDVISPSTLLSFLGKKGKTDQEGASKYIGRCNKKDV